MTPQELAELDLAVAKVEGFAAPPYRAGIEAYMTNPPKGHTCSIFKDGKFERVYQPTRDGAEAMRLLEKHKLVVCPSISKDWWLAYTSIDLGAAQCLEGQTPAIAICRAVVALKEAEGGTDE